MNESVSPTILFTSSLSDKKKEKLAAAGLRFQAIPFISFTYNPPVQWLSKVPRDCDGWIFTSKRAVKAVRKKLDNFIVPEYIFAVGEKTANKLRKISLTPITPQKFNAEALSHLISRYDLDRLVHFRGNLGANELKKSITRQGAEFIEIEVYRTVLNSTPVDESELDGIVFMSPSAVKSFHQVNNVEGETTIFCIGPSTRDEAKKFGITNSVLPHKSTFEDMIQTIKNHFG